MTKVHGKRYAYKFDFHGLMAACQAQAQGQGSDVMPSYGKYHAGAHAQMPLLPPSHPAAHPTPGTQPTIFPTSAYWYSSSFEHRGSGFN